jgi:hypothetical protein
MILYEEIFREFRKQKAGRDKDLRDIEELKIFGRKK